MEFNQTLLFFFSALGAFNGLCLGFYFLFATKPKHISNRFLGILLLMMSVRIGKSVFLYFQPYLAYIYLQIGITACFFIGPFLYFYVKSVVKPNSNVHKEWKYHLFILVPFILIIGILYPFETNLALWRPYVVYGTYLQWLAYILISGWVLRNELKLLITSPRALQTRQVWLLSIFLGNLLIWAAYFFTNFTYYIVGALTFSFLFYLLAFLVIATRKRNQNLFVPDQKYKDKKIASGEAVQLLEKLEQFMKTEEAFTNANLKSSDLAKEMQISVHQLSQLLNDNLGKSFPIFVNEHRIAKAQKMLASNQTLTLEAIGYECGFNSKSTFYTSFKKIVGSTPAQYKAQL